MIGPEYLFRAVKGLGTNQILSAPD